MAAAREGGSGGGGGGGRREEEKTAALCEGGRAEPWTRNDPLGVRERAVGV